MTERPAASYSTGAGSRFPPGASVLPDGAIIYELHVGGFTRHPSSGVKHPGTFAGLTEKIPYLCELGVTHVELLPVMAFDEQDVPAAAAARGRHVRDARIAHRIPGCCRNTRVRWHLQPGAIKRKVCESHRAVPGRFMAHLPCC